MLRCQIEVLSTGFTLNSLSIQNRIIHRLPSLQTNRRLLTHWGRVTHICVSELTIIGSDNGLSPGRSQAIICICCGDIVNWSLRNKLQWNFNRNSNIFIQENALEHVVCEMASILSRPQCVKYMGVCEPVRHRYSECLVTSLVPNHFPNQC